MVYVVLVLLYVFVYSFITYIFRAYIFLCLVLCIVDVAHVECAYILNLLYSRVEFNFVG
jgi:hypothetical protein